MNRKNESQDLPRVMINGVNFQIERAIVGFYHEAFGAEYSKKFLASLYNRHTHAHNLTCTLGVYKHVISITYPLVYFSHIDA